MKAFCIGDPHAKVSNAKEISTLADESLEMALKHNADVIVVLGDLSDSFEKVHLQAWNSVVYFMEKLSSSHIPLIYLVGNHCALNNQIFLTDEHFFNAFKKWSNVTIVDKPTWRNNCLFVPYVPPGRFAEAIGTEDWQLADVIFCHQEFLGVQMGPITSTVGDAWDINSPLVISGHIHESQWLSNNIYYAGTPYQTSFGDNGDKYVYLLDTVTKDLGFLQIKGIPKKISINADCDSFKEIEVDSENKYRITISDTTENIHKLKKTNKYKELSLITKIIIIPKDAAQLAKKVAKVDSYTTILQKAVAKESKLVQSMAEEVIK